MSDLPTCWCGQMKIEEASDTVLGVAIDYLTCTECGGSYYDQENLDKLKKVFAPNGSKSDIPA